MIKATGLAIAVFVSALAVSGCSPNADGGSAEKAASDLAKPIDENTYVNEQFGLTITAPVGWYVMDNAVTKKLMEVGRDVSTANMDARTKAAMTAAASNTINLFGFMQYAPGKPVESNPSILGVAENVVVAPGIERGSDYLFHVKRLLAQSSLEVEVADGFQAIKIDGKDFDRMDLTSSASGHVMYQRYFAARHGDHVVSFIQTYQDTAELAELDKVLASVKLKW